MPGRLTSRMRQLGQSVASSRQNCSAVSNPIECRQADLRSPWIDARTRASSSIMYTVGTAADAIFALSGTAQPRRRREWRIYPGTTLNCIYDLRSHSPSAEFWNDGPPGMRTPSSTRKLASYATIRLMWATAPLSAQRTSSETSALTGECG